MNSLLIVDDVNTWEVGKSLHRFGYNLRIKDLGHIWLGYIRMLGHLQISAHLPNFDIN